MNETTEVSKRLEDKPAAKGQHDDAARAGPVAKAGEKDSQSNSLVGVANTLKDAFETAKRVEDGEDLSPDSASSKVPLGLRSLIYNDVAGVANGRTYGLPQCGEEWRNKTGAADQLRSCAPASHYPLANAAALPYYPEGSEPPILSPKDVVINAGKRKRLDSMHRIGGAKESGQQQQSCSKIQLRNVDFMRAGPPPPSKALRLSQHSSAISQGIASGQMKMDPYTNNYVPNDIFVQAMGPGGVLPDVPTIKKHSKYRGVTKHRRSGRWESHIWLKESGKQMYLGAYEHEEHAAEAYDVAALKIKGNAAKTNFDVSKYKQYMELLDSLTLAELVKTVKSRIPPPVRNTSNYRGVTFNTRSGMWEAKYQANNTKKQVSLGLFKDDVQAAREFDKAMVRNHGTGASINFNHEDYKEELLSYHQNQLNNL